MTIATIVGARPQFVKAAAVSRAIADYNRGTPAGKTGVKEILVHTGQHYDHAMSRVFFEELSIPEPDINLDIGSAAHGAQTGRMIEAVESTLTSMNHDLVLVYGDTNSTLSGALAAAKLNIPVVHVEAGLRSYNKSMPEEINRILTDHTASLLFCPTRIAVENLKRESITRGVHLVGDVMYDSILHHQSRIGESKDVLDAYNLSPGRYLLVTVHRAENTDDPERLRAIFDTLAIMAKQTPVAFALHPRTGERLKRHGISVAGEIILMPALPYLSMLQLEKNALAIVTDSGGMQKEALFFSRPCMTLREETEWKETVKQGANTLCGTDRDRILQWHARLLKGDIRLPVNHFPYGNGRAAEKILEIILNAYG